MRNLSAFLLTLSGLGLAGPVQAANGRIDLTWGETCTPIVQNLVPTAVPQSLIASVLGNDETHNAYQVWCLFGSATRTVPDAWRFDAAGCQGSPFITIRHLPPGPLSKACPAFQGTNVSYQLKDYQFVHPNSIYDPTIVRFYLANTYPDGFTTLEDTRYMLMQVIFDHTYSVSGPATPGSFECGGLETPMCVVLLQGRHHLYEGSSSYIKLEDGLQYWFDDSPNGILTVHDIAGCPSVPSQNTTWGQIKSQYRN